MEQFLKKDLDVPESGGTDVSAWIHVHVIIPSHVYHMHVAPFI